MKKNQLKYLWCLVIILVFFPTNAQRNEELPGVEIPEEEIFVHYNSTLLFTGEYLYYKLYCFNAVSGQLSNLSKVAYIELINEEKTSIYKQKVRLEEGVGQDDFFIPVSVPSGNYKLIAYTKWMLNKTDGRFFKGDITVINPYEGDQKVFLNPEINLEQEKASMKKSVASLANLTLDKGNYAHRAKVVLTLNDEDEKLSGGNYSLSVRQKYAMKVAPQPSAQDFTLMYPARKGKRSLSGADVLPELRGELISGKVSFADSNLAASAKNVALSIPGAPYELKVFRTNTDGSFYTNLNKAYEGEEGYIQVLGEDRDEYVVTLTDDKELDYGTLDFFKFQLDRSMRETITANSVYNQIENAFFSVKPDSLKFLEGNTSFYGSKPIVYHLDEYTRFNTVRETVVEVLEDVYTRKNDEGLTNFQVRGYYASYNQSGSLPLVLVDGVLIQDHERFLESSARKVKTVKLVKDKYFLGPQIFQGILDFETFDGDYYETINEGYLKEIALTKPSLKKDYFQQTYSETNPETDRIPDFRSQLLWMSETTIENTPKTIVFYTSDRSGTFTIQLEGFNSNGKPVSISKDFLVE